MNSDSGFRYDVVDLCQLNDMAGSGKKYEIVSFCTLNGTDETLCIVKLFEEEKKDVELFIVDCSEFEVAAALSYACLVDECGRVVFSTGAILGRTLSAKEEGVYDWARKHGYQISRRHYQKGLGASDSGGFDSEQEREPPDIDDDGWDDVDSRAEINGDGPLPGDLPNESGV